MIKKKNIVLLLIGFHFTIPGFAQERNVDSLWMELSRTTEELSRFDLINNILLDITSGRASNIDSSITMEMVEIAQTRDIDSLKAISYNWLGSYFFQMKGDNTTALEYYFKALPLAEAIEDKRRISSIYFDIAIVFSSMNADDKAFEAVKKGGENLPDIDHPLFHFMNYQYIAGVVDYYLNVQNVDSALYYLDLSSKAVVHLGSSESYLRLESLQRGATYALSGDIEKADDYFNRTLEWIDDYESLAINLLFHNHYLPFLLSQNRIEDGILQSKKLLKTGEEYKNNNMKLVASQYLRQFYDVKNQTDSAYYYSRMEAQINADMFNQDNKNRMEALLLNDQLRRIEEKNRAEIYQNQLKQYALLFGLGTVFIVALILFRNNREKQRTNSVLEKTLEHLKSTQTQLVHAEKMASLGELTAGIAHEIQNPLNFVNNFSEVNGELIDEQLEEIEKGDYEEVKELALIMKENSSKINHHGKRADAIVKGMLAHSRTGKGEKELTDINQLADEYLRLSYHGLRAKDSSFNAEFKTDFDPELPKVNVIPQDIGRVLLNLINNAFQACAPNVHASTGLSMTGLVTVSTKLIANPKGTGSQLQIAIKDNGPGIPDSIKDKIFQPFFTTKPTGQGTGLGLSLSYDIVKAHGGALTLNNSKGEGCEFILSLPI